MLKSILTTITLGLALTATPNIATGEENTERAVLVLDASGSMWGQVEKTPKIAVARSVIGKLLSDWDPKVQLGVTAYGHREKGNCSDIETLVPVGNVNADTIMAVVNDLEPKGKTPLSDAVRQAARDLKYTEERATVILVSDGKETCNANPCAMAAELEKTGIDFTVHVVGFDLTDEEKAQLRCVADKTGGKFLSANNASELHKAMATTVKMVAEAKPAKTRVVKLKTGLTGSVIVKGVRGRHAKIYEADKKSKKVLASFHRNSKRPAQLTPGTYVIAKHDKELTRIDLAAGKNVVVDMKDLTGTVFVKGVKGRHALIYENGKSQNDTLASFNPNTKAPAQLVPGTYVIGTRIQEITRVDLAAGKDVVVDMSAHTGTILMKGVQGRHVLIYQPGKTPNQALASFNTNTKSPAQLVPGTYVIAKRNQKLKQVDLAAGDNMVVDMADLTGSLRLKGLKDILVSVYEKGKTPGEALATFNRNTKTPAQLLPGSYTLGTRKQELGSIELKAGEELVVDLSQ